MTSVIKTGITFKGEMEEKDPNTKTIKIALQKPKPHKLTNHPINNDICLLYIRQQIILKLSSLKHGAFCFFMSLWLLADGSSPLSPVSKWVKVSFLTRTSRGNL